MNDDVEQPGKEVTGHIDSPAGSSIRMDKSLKERGPGSWLDRVLAKSRAKAVPTMRIDTPKADPLQDVEAKTKPAKPSAPSTDTKPGSPHDVEVKEQPAKRSKSSPKAKTDSKTESSEPKPTISVCKHCNKLFVKGGPGAEYNCGAYHAGDLKSKAKLLSQYHGEGTMNQRGLDKLPDPVWNCCLKEEFWPNCLHRFTPHEARR